MIQPRRQLRRAQAAPRGTPRPGNVQHPISSARQPQSLLARGGQHTHARFACTSAFANDPDARQDAPGCPRSEQDLPRFRSASYRRVVAAVYGRPARRQLPAQMIWRRHRSQRHKTDAVGVPARRSVAAMARRASCRCRGPACFSVSIAALRPCQHRRNALDLGIVDQRRGRLRAARASARPPIRRCCVRRPRYWPFWRRCNRRPTAVSTGSTGRRQPLVASSFAPPGLRKVVIGWRHYRAPWPAARPTGARGAARRTRSCGLPRANSRRARAASCVRSRRPPPLLYPVPAEIVSAMGLSNRRICRKPQ